MYRSAIAILFLLLFWVQVPESWAPEIVEPDATPFHAYEIYADSSLRDSNGVIRGWLRDGNVYDTQWNAKTDFMGISGQRNVP